MFQHRVNAAGVTKWGRVCCHEAVLVHQAPFPTLEAVAGRAAGHFDACDPVGPSCALLFGQPTAKAAAPAEPCCGVRKFSVKRMEMGGRHPPRLFIAIIRLGRTESQREEDENKPRVKSFVPLHPGVRTGNHTAISSNEMSIFTREWLQPMITRLSDGYPSTNSRRCYQCCSIKFRL